MTLEEFDSALIALGWKVTDFCRATGLHRNTPGRWRREGAPIPEWVPHHLALLLDLRRLAVKYLEDPIARTDAGDAPAPAGTGELDLQG